MGSFVESCSSFQHDFWICVLILHILNKDMFGMIVCEIVEIVCKLNLMIT